SAFQDCVSLTGVTISDGVMSIGDDAFAYCDSLASVTMPGSLASIGDEAFIGCDNLTNVIIPYGVIFIGGNAFAFSGLTSMVIPDSVTILGDSAFADCAALVSVKISASVASTGNFVFYGCTSLTNVVIPDGITTIGSDAFGDCSSLASVIIPGTVTNLELVSFDSCTSLARIYFEGNAPVAEGALAIFQGSLGMVFSGDPGTVYYLPGTTGWTNTFAGLPTALWYQPNPLILNGGPGFGVQNNRFGFTVSWATNTSVVVEACTNLTRPVWQPVQTNSLASGTNYFSDAKWTNYPGRFYRVRTR
ncbi:MAG TPA: leucine-rich repeat domain-containing protein, partial [Verrucomicrobiae bacterium]|nr:leucine-rich repeat domain-containing protein [Verrucomicrobiae bacterium]